MENTHISKELLRNSLRPILQYLQQVRTLSLPLLDGLARLLMLLRQNFNANLGEKLLEVLSCWSDPDKVAAVKVRLITHFLTSLAGLTCIGVEAKRVGSDPREHH